MATASATAVRARTAAWFACVIASVAGLSSNSSALAKPAPISLNVGAEASSQLSFIGEKQLSSRLLEITLQTSAVVTASLGPIAGNPTGLTKVRVLLPKGYDPKRGPRYPVLYLYHGGGGNETEWTTPASKGMAEELTKDLPLIVVMPDGGAASGYADWYNGGAFGAPRWKTYHLDQLIPWVDAHFRTIADRTGRATAGLSMGGGGLRYAAQRPDLIGATAAFSGDIDILQPASDWNGMGAPVSRMIWGDRKAQEVRWRGVNGPDLAANLVNTDVAIFTGDTGRPEGIYILQGSTALQQRLNALGIRHAFTLYPGMTHSWPTWNKALAQWLPSLMRYFAAARRASGRMPATFTYSTIAPSYSIYGWNVEIDRRALEFSALEVLDKRGFDLTGSGKASVQTPAFFRAGAKVRVVLSREGESGSTSMILQANGRGRLAVPIDLGPANAFQQYSPEADAMATGGPVAKTPFRLLNNGSSFYRVHVQLKAR